MTSESTTDKPFRIEKRQVYEAYKAVKANHGAAGVDGETLEMFEKDLTRNLYKIWNRMSSGTYFEPHRICRRSQRGKVILAHTLPINRLRWIGDCLKSAPRFTIQRACISILENSVA